MAKKFIIYDGDLVIGHVDFHRQFTKDFSKVRGGGYWHIDKEDKKLYLYGGSDEFGKASLDTVKDAVTNGLLSPSLESMNIFYSELNTLEDALIKNTLIYKPQN